MEVLDQTGQRAFQGHKPSGLLRFGFRLFAGRDGSLRSVMNVWTIGNITVFMARSVAARQCQGGRAGRVVRDAAGEIAGVGQVLALVNRETGLQNLLSDRLECALTVRGPRLGLVRPKRAGIGNPLGH